MAQRVMQSGFDLVVFDTDDLATSEFEGTNVSVATSLDELVVECNIICLCLPGPDEMEKVMFGKGGVEINIRPGTLVIDHTTNSPTLVRQVEKRLKLRKAAMIDAPVSGGVEGAKTRDLTLLVGGESKIVKHSMPILNAIGKTVLHVGDIGTGTICKLMHNSASLSMMLTMVQCLTTGVKAGVNASTIVEVFQKCALGKNFDLQVRLPNTLFKGDFDPRFSLKLAYKDLKLAMEIADKFNVPFSIPEICEKEMSQAISRGLDMKDSSIFLTMQEEKAGVEIRTN